MQHLFAGTLMSSRLSGSCRLEGGRASLLARQADIRGGLEVPTLSADLERCVLHGGHACAKPWAGRGSRGGEPCR